MFNLSKTRYCTGLRCPKILWLDLHKSDVKESTAVNQARLDEGTRVGELARGYFGDYTLIKGTEKRRFPQDNIINSDEANPVAPEDSEDLEEVAQYFDATMERIAKLKEKAYSKLQLTRTQRLLRETDKLLGKDLVEINSTFCEASFATEDGFCSVDILRTIDDGYNIAAYEIIEVKSSTSLKPEHLDDMAYQYHILNKRGLKVTKVSLMHINNQYERMGELDIKKLFTLVDCTNEVLEKQKEIPFNIKRIKEIAGTETEPDISIGKHCSNPYTCAYIQYCSGREEKAPANDQSPIVDNEKIKTFLDSLSYPLYHLDFETFYEAIPSFDHQRPYQKIPFQYSLHIQKEEGSEPIHHEFLAKAETDSRREIAERLCAEIPKDACVLAYSMPFEKDRIKELAGLFPDLAPHLMAIHDNMKDLIVPFRAKAWRSPAQEGSNSLKDVVPSMFPGDPQLDYSKLDLIHNGGEAMDAYASLPNLSPEEQQRTRAALLAYCRLDTLVMVKILDKLREEAKE